MYSHAVFSSVPPTTIKQTQPVVDVIPIVGACVSTIKCLPFPLEKKHEQSTAIVLPFRYCSVAFALRAACWETDAVEFIACDAMTLCVRPKQCPLLRNMNVRNGIE